MPSHGVVPALSSLRGAIGYFERGGGRRPDGPGARAADGGDAAAAAAEERLGLLQGQPKEDTAAAAALPARENGRLHTFDVAAPGLPLHDQQQQQQHHLGLAGSSSSRLQQGGDADVGASGDGGGGGGSSSKRCRYESLDYELIDNTVFRTDAASATHTDHITKSGVKWTICCALGVITAVAAFAVNFGVENLAGFKFWATLSLLEQGYVVPSFLVYAAINAALVVGSVALTTSIAPAAAGSGIAEVKAYLNGIDVPSIFLFKTLAVKLAGSVGAVAGGLAVGKEGPFVHAGACLGALLSQGGSAGVHLTWFRRYWNDADRRDFVACGTAAGVAAAFRSPVGGVLFALEEMTSWWRNQLLWYAFFTTAVVSVSVRALMRVCQSAEGQGGTCGFFGSGGYLLYEITQGQENFDILELAPVLLLGVIGGLLGAAFTSLNEKLAAWRKEVLLPFGQRGRLWEALGAALLTSGVSFMLPLLAMCQPCPPDSGGQPCPRLDNAHSGNFVNFACAPGGRQYNDLATIFFNTQDDAIRNLFSAQTKSEYSVSALLTFGAMFFLLAVISYGVALPTGLFVPSILCGAAYGRLVGVFMADLRPLLGSSSIDEGTYALLGAASFLGGCMRMTVATCVMLLELTNNLALLPLMMLVTLVAKAVGDGTGVAPIYESLMSLKGLPFLSPAPSALAHHITASEAAGRPAITFARVERVGTILDVLTSSPHNGFAVIERGVTQQQQQQQQQQPAGGGPDTGGDGGGEQQQQQQHILGIVLRSQLVVLLRSRRCFQPTSFVSELAGRVAFSYQGSDFARPISEAPPPGGPCDVAGLSLSPQERAMYLDLGPYVNPSYYVVQEDTSLSKVYTLFRSLGLRHLAVIPRAPSVVGVITRHDLMPQALEDTFMEHVPLGSGAAGLASALRGTVRQALESYHTQAARQLGPHHLSHPGGRLSSSGSGVHHLMPHHHHHMGGLLRGTSLGLAGPPSRAEGLRIALGVGPGGGGGAVQQQQRPAWAAAGGSGNGGALGLQASQHAAGTSGAGLGAGAGQAAAGGRPRSRLVVAAAAAADAAAGGAGASAAPGGGSASSKHGDGTQQQQQQQQPAVAGGVGLLPGGGDSRGGTNPVVLGLRSNRLSSGSSWSDFEAVGGSEHGSSTNGSAHSSTPGSSHGVLPAAAAPEHQQQAAEQQPGGGQQQQRSRLSLAGLPPSLPSLQ